MHCVVFLILWNFLHVARSLKCKVPCQLPFQLNEVWLCPKGRITVKKKLKKTIQCAPLTIFNFTTIVFYIATGRRRGRNRSGNNRGNNRDTGNQFRGTDPPETWRGNLFVCLSLYL